MSYDKLVEGKKFRTDLEKYEEMKKANWVLEETATPGVMLTHCTAHDTWFDPYAEREAETCWQCLNACLEEEG